MAITDKLAPPTGEAVITAILERMREELHPLKYSVLVHGAYRIYLQCDDFEHLEPYFEDIRVQAGRALDDALVELNAKRRILGKKDPRHYESREGTWQIEFFEDTDLSTQPGAIVVRSELKSKRRSPHKGLPGETEVVPREAAKTDPAEAEYDAQTRLSGDRVVATIVFTDKHGPRTFQMTRSQITIGRDAADSNADLRLNTGTEVSRKHAEIRRDPLGRFFIKDLSDFGTTVNGVPINPSIVHVEGAERNQNIESLLPPRARIGLAGRMFLDFEVAKES